MFLRALINSSSVTGALTDPELDGSNSGATFSIGSSGLWCLHFPVGNDTVSQGQRKASCFGWQNSPWRFRLGEV